MEFFLFSGLMFIDMIVFAALAFNYKYVDQLKDTQDDGPNRNEKENCDGKINAAYEDDETKF